MIGGSTSQNRVILTMFWHITNSEIKLEEAAVLHYTYTKFSDLTSRRDRCGCKPTKEDVKRCFMLDFDRAVSKDVFLSIILKLNCSRNICCSWCLPLYDSASYGLFYH